MKFSFEWIKELSATTLSPQQAADLLSAKAFEVESVEDDVMDIKILPNRPDCLSHVGIARELCALEGRRFAAPQYEYTTGSHPAVSIEVQDHEGCPRFSALVITGVTVGPSPSWLKDRLERLGMRSINTVVDVTNYVMLALGQPMHAFDLQKIDGLVIRRARDGERLAALDEARTEYTLTSDMLVVADQSKPLAIAGIKGGADSGISTGTTRVLLEAAHWDPSSVRATSRSLGLRTDASIRFSYGVDPNLTAAALVYAAQLLKKAGAGTADGAIIDVYPKPRVARELLLDPEYTRSLLGTDIGDAQMRSILESLGFDVHDGDGGYNVTVPTRRMDVEGQEDCAEEIARVYGYDAIPSAAPLVSAFDDARWVQEDAEGIAWDEYAFIRERGAIAHLLAGAGYTEVYNYAFLSDELKELMRAGELYELAQPLSADYRWLRRSLIPRLLVNARDNVRFFDQVRLFETGHVFDHIGTGRESTRLGLVLAKKGNDTDMFYELKGAVDLLLQRLGVADYYFDDIDPMQWDASAVHATVTGARALIRLEGDGHVIGFVGVVSGRIAEALKLKGGAVVAEFCLRSLIRHAQREREFAPLPKYPSVVRDIAVLVDQGVKIDDILNAAQNAGGDIVEDVDVFDIFVPTGKEKIKPEGDTPEYGKSVAFHVVFRASDRTLTDKEVATAESAIKKALQENLGAQVR
jgi:phenylalanyl-tRNA synthetase beta chain